MGINQSSQGDSPVICHGRATSFFSLGLADLSFSFIILERDISVIIIGVGKLQVGHHAE